MTRRRGAVPVLAAAGAWGLRHATSRAVRGWAPGAGERRTAGPLAVRVAGSGDPMVLCHGVAASGDTFGAGFDPVADGARLIVPDLLGFGRSLAPERDDFSPGAHVAALDAMATALGLDGAPITVAGHSFGALVALRWAARHRDVARVVTFCAPLYDTPAEADEHIVAMGLLERFFALEGPVARWTCATMCATRTASQWVAVAISPQWPVAIARGGVRHTWPAYLGAMNGFIRSNAWRDDVATLAARGVPVLLADGARDPVPVAGRAEALAGDFDTVTVRVHPRASHDLPVAYPAWCRTLL